jgi:simple sugar transport system ATP-binding protein
MRALQESGVTFLYISHHLEEIYEICKTVTVMRDGRVVADASLDDLPKDMLVGAMVGEAAMSTRSADHRDRSAAPENAGGLEIGGLTVTGHVDAINLNIRPGECVGLVGLAGSGKDHVAEVVAGLLIPTSGEVSIDGVRAPRGNVEAIRAAGVGFVPRDRHRATFPLLSVAENLTITVLDRFGALGLVSPSRRTSAADQKIREVGIVTESSEQPIGQLRGGNQQKTVVARALTSEPKVLVLVAPTQGVDVASKEALFQIMGSAAAEKMAVLIVSEDLDELAICDRLEIIFRGKIEAGASTMSSPRWKDFGESMNVDVVQGEVGAATTAVLRRLFTRDLLLIPVIIVGSFVSPGFLLPENLMNVLQQSSELSILVIAESIILLCGKFDVSLESTVGFAPMIAAWLMVPDTSIGGSGVGVGGYTGIAWCWRLGS